MERVLRRGLLCELEEEHVVLIMYNLLCALRQMHSMNIVHRDIKPSNILINKDCRIKICDLGMARTLPNSCTGSESGNSIRLRDSILKRGYHEKGLSKAKVRELTSRKLEKRMIGINRRKRCLSSHVGSRWYRAPEISLIQKQYDYAVDIWSLGCCYYELLRVLSESLGGPSSQINRVLIPGKACYPLSPHRNKDIFIEEDQLSLTLKVIGKIE